MYKAIGFICLALTATLLLIAISSQGVEAAGNRQFSITARPTSYNPNPSGIFPGQHAGFICNNAGFAIFSFNGSGQSGGFAAVRIWANGHTIVDSFIPGHQSIYAPITNGSYGGAVFLAVQTPGTFLNYTIYRALVAAPMSWDGQLVETGSFICP